MKPTPPASRAPLASSLVTLMSSAALTALLFGLGACDRKPSPTPPKPTTSAVAAGPLVPAIGTAPPTR